MKFLNDYTRKQKWLRRIHEYCESLTDSDFEVLVERIKKRPFWYNKVASAYVDYGKETLPRKEDDSDFLACRVKAHTYVVELYVGQGSELDIVKVDNV